MKLIGAGYGRTGTRSLQWALEQLGYDPCYHMETVILKPTHVKLWQAIADGSKADWSRLFARHQAGVDFPISLYYRELMEVYPDAKFILTVRDPERWYRSTFDTIFQVPLITNYLSILLPPLKRFNRMTNSIIWDGEFEGRFADRDFAIGKFKRHIEQVIATIPPERLLVFEVRDGWQPLCEFLDVPMPATPFPHANERVAMMRRLRIAKVLNTVVPRLLLLLVSAALALFLWVLIQGAS